MKSVSAIVMGAAAAFAAVSLACTACGATAEIRFTFAPGYGASRVETRRLELKPVGDDGAHYRAVIRKTEIPPRATSVSIIPEFMTARRGDEGWWMSGRGVYGSFDVNDGRYTAIQQLMPVFALRRNGTLWYAHVKTWRFNYDFVANVKGGVCEAYARFKCDKVREQTGRLYDDIVVDFHRLDGDAADYNGVARAYREHQLSSGAVRTIKDRMNPVLDYLCDAIVVRIQTHAAKPIPETSDGIKKKFFSAGEELPVVVHMPFAVAEKFLQSFKDAGIDKLSICSAGWQDGGYDGRVPGHFPIGEEAGGAEAFASLISKAKSLGYQFALHATNTDGYRCSKLWDEDWVCKLANGRLSEGGLWAGGQCYWVCQQCAWERWLPEEMRKMADLGIRGPHYIDVYSATYPIACADPRHPCTPEKTAELQNRILAYGRELMGGAASESGYDHVAGNIDYINYVERDLKRLSDGRHSRLVRGVFPLWELVYHGIILYNPDRLTQNHTRGKCLYKLEKSGDPRWMEGDGVEDPRDALKIIEFGGRPIFYTYKFADVPRIKKAWDEFVPVRYLQRELMESHREVATGVFETRYADGSRTVVNYNKEPVEADGRRVPALGYLLLPPNGAARTFVFDAKAGLKEE